MNTTDAAKEEIESNVVYMGDYLIRRFNEIKAVHDRLVEQADALSKMDKDKFAAPLRGKADALETKLEKLSTHIRFIMRGGHGTQKGGYQLNYTPPPVKITVSIPA